MFGKFDFLAWKDRHIEKVVVFQSWCWKFLLKTHVVSFWFQQQVELRDGSNIVLKDFRAAKNLLVLEPRKLTFVGHLMIW